MNELATTTVLNDDDVDAVRVLWRTDDPSATLPPVDEPKYFSAATLSSPHTYAAISGYLAVVNRTFETARLFEPIEGIVVTWSTAKDLYERGLAVSNRLAHFTAFSTHEARKAALSEEVSTIFLRAEGEVFEDGMESLFAKELKSLIERHGKHALEFIEPMVADSARTDPAIIGEAFKCLGLIRHRASHDERLAVLVAGLSAASPQTRDGALVGLSFLGDPRALIPLETAASHEENALLRRFMREVIAQLRKST